MPHRSRPSIHLLDLSPDQPAAGTAYWATVEVSCLEPLGATRHRDMGSFRQRFDPASPLSRAVGVETGEAVQRHAVSRP